MPITENILDHEVLGREFKKGRLDGELTLLRRLIAKRFGTVPVWLEERMTSYSASDLEALSERVLDAQSLDDLAK